eukprot:405522-Pelagomonas_calceolata.AAC.1
MLHSLAIATSTIVKHSSLNPAATFDTTCRYHYSRDFGAQFQGQGVGAPLSRLYARFMGGHMQWMLVLEDGQELPLEDQDGQELPLEDQACYDPTDPGGRKSLALVAGIAYFHASILARWDAPGAMPCEACMLVQCVVRPFVRQDDPGAMPCKAPCAMPYRGASSAGMTHEQCPVRHAIWCDDL